MVEDTPSTAYKAGASALERVTLPYKTLATALPSKIKRNRFDISMICCSYILTVPPKMRLVLCTCTSGRIEVRSENHIEHKLVS